MDEEVPFELIQSNTPKDDRWSFLDAVYCITLKDRDDRRMQAEDELRRVGMHATMFVAERPQQNRQKGYGCFNSHRQVCRVARDASLRTILVLEDDFVFDSDIMPDVLARQIDDAIKSLPRDWTRLQLGSLPIASVYYNEHADRAASTFAHAQIWSRAGIEYMASMEYTPNVYHDLSLALKLEHSYDIRPMVCYQRVLGSDNTPGLAERLFSNEDAMKTNVWLLPVIITLISISICIVWYSILLRYTSLGKLKSFGVATVCTVIPLGITLAIIIR